jgi:hypothetical protein
MYAVLVTYENDTPVEEAKQHPDNFGFAEELKSVDGFMMKTWLNDGATFGGFYIFADKHKADAFINSELFQSAVPGDSSNRNVQIKGFEVFDELSGKSGVTV